MKKLIKNLFILLIFIAIFGGIIYFLYNFILNNEEVAEIFSPIYDEAIAITKSNGEENIENPLNEIKTTANSENSQKFYYSQLDSYAKIIYDKLYENKENMKTGTYTIEFGKTFNTLLNSENGETQMNKSYQSALDAYLLDNPDIFYLDVTKIYLLMNSRTVGKKTTYTVNIGGQNGISYLDEGYYSKEQVDRAESQVQAIANGVLSNMDSNTYQKIKGTHNWLVDNLTYDQTLSKDNIRNIYGALYIKEVVCEGYAKAYKYLLDKIGIENIIVVGYGTNSEGKTEEHAWNYLKLNGNWYATDVTWDDPIIYGGGKLSDKNRYKYFLNGSHSFNDTHTATGQISSAGIQFTYPELNLTNFN